MDPDLVDQLIRDLVLESLMAQQDVTRVADPRDRVEREPQSELQNLLFNIAQGLDPTMGLGTSLAGMRPDDPNIKLQIALGLLTGGSLGKLLKAGGKGAAKGLGAAKGGIDDLLQSIFGRGSKGAEKSTRSVRGEIFQGLKREDPFGDADVAFERLIDQLDDLARRRGSTQSRAVTRSDFKVDELVEDALNRLTEGRKGLAKSDEAVARVRKSLDDLFR